MAQVAGLQVGEVGAKIVLETGLPDLSVFSGFSIRAFKPNLVEVVWPAVVEGPPTDGNISYTTAAGDLDRRGEWRFVAEVTDGAAVLIGEAARVRVKEPGEIG